MYGISKAVVKNWPKGGLRTSVLKSFATKRQKKKPVNKWHRR